MIGIYGGLRIGDIFKTTTSVERIEVDLNIEAYVDGDEAFLPCKLEDYELPNEPLISVKAKKRIVKTPVPGLSGTVKEHIQLDDYKITIKGIAVNDMEDDLPQNDIRQIRELCEKLGSLKITNRLLAYFNIDQLVIESFDFPAAEGMQNAQLYIINAVSDRTIDLEKIVDE